MQIGMTEPGRMGASTARRLAQLRNIFGGHGVKPAGVRGVHAVSKMAKS